MNLWHLGRSQGKGRSGACSGKWPVVVFEKKVTVKERRNIRSEHRGGYMTCQKKNSLNAGDREKGTGQGETKGID